jgi:hypothetical protein
MTGMRATQRDASGRPGRGGRAVLNQERASLCNVGRIGADPLWSTRNCNACHKVSQIHRHRLAQSEETNDKLLKVAFKDVNCLILPDRRICSFAISLQYCPNSRGQLPYHPFGRGGCGAGPIRAHTA